MADEKEDKGLRIEAGEVKGAPGVGLPGASATVSTGSPPVEPDRYFGFAEATDGVAGFNQAPLYFGQIDSPDVPVNDSLDDGIAKHGPLVDDGFIAHNFGDGGEQAAAQIVSSRQPSAALLSTLRATNPPLVLSDNMSASTTPTAIGGRVGSKTDSEVSASHAAMLERIDALEQAMKAIVPPPAGMGHNHPPEPMYDFPFSAKQWRKLKRGARFLKTEPVFPTDEPKRARQIAAMFKRAATSIGAFIARHGETFASETAKSAGSEYGKWAGRGLAGVTAIGLTALFAYAHEAVLHWIHLLGF